MNRQRSSMSDPVSRADWSNQFRNAFGVVLYDTFGRRVAADEEGPANDSRAPARLAQFLDGADLVVQAEPVQVWRRDMPPGEALLIMGDGVLARHLSGLAVFLSDHSQSWRFLDNLPIGVLVLDENFDVVDANYRIGHFLDRDCKDVLGAAWKVLFPGQHLLDMAAHFADRQRGSFPFKCVWTLPAAGEALRHFAVTVVRRWSGGGAESVSGFLLSMIDVGPEVRVRRSLERLADEDPLTHCMNRRALVCAIESLPTEQLGRCAVAFVDIDHFKEINDVFGHDAGDHVLKAVAARLRAAVRDTDLIARFGGDEFALVMLEVDGEAALNALGEKLQCSLNGQVTRGSENIPLSCSIGMVTGESTMRLVTGDGLGSMLDRLLRQADVAMYDAKRRAGGGVTRLYSEAVERSRDEGRDRVHEFVELGTADRLRFVFQPIFRGGDVYALEALTRIDAQLVHHGSIVDLIATAKQNRHGFEFLNQMAEGQIRAFGEGRRESGCLRTLSLQVNVDADQMDVLSFPDMLHRWCAEAGVQPSSVIVELTEVALETTSSNMIDSVQRLRDLGFRVSMDDFGEGFSSLKRLAQYHFDQLKIDRFFVAHALSSDKYRSLAQGMVALGQAMGVQLVAEGVETSAEYAFFDTLGVNLIQGFYMARPMPMEQLIPFVCSRLQH